MREVLVAVLMVIGLSSNTAVSANGKSACLNVEEWPTFHPPSEAAVADRKVWLTAANHAPISWTVDRDKQTLCARQSGQGRASNPVLALDLRKQISGLRKSFGWRKPSAIHARENGTLVGWDAGEWGGGLVWFPNNGKPHTLVNDNIFALIESAEGLFALTGLCHMGLADGSLLRLDPSEDGWRVHAIRKWSDCPVSWVRSSNGVRTFIAFSKSLLVLRNMDEEAILLTNAGWEYFYPQSMALDSDEHLLYLGMRQFVGRLDLQTGRLELRAPSEEALYRLPEEEEKSIRALWQPRR